jgi:hypothetical protein
MVQLAGGHARGVKFRETGLDDSAAGGERGVQGVENSVLVAVVWIAVVVVVRDEDSVLRTAQQTSFLAAARRLMRAGVRLALAVYSEGP